MTKDECDKIWDIIFARHRALVKMGVAGHEGLNLDNIYEDDCNCITTILGQHGYDFTSCDVFGGINPVSLSSAWKKRFLNFEKKALAV